MGQLCDKLPYVIAAIAAIPALLQRLLVLPYPHKSLEIPASSGPLQSYTLL